MGRASFAWLGALASAVALAAAHPRPVGAQTNPFAVAQPPQATINLRVRPDTRTLPATLIADQIEVDARGRLVATGAVEVWQGSVRLTARRIVYDPAGSSIDIEGPMTLSDGPDQILLADGAALSSDLREGLMESARIVLHQQLQIAAQRVERREGRYAQMDAAIASTCEVCAANPTPLWEVRAARVIHDEETRRLRFQDAQFRLRGVPVFWLPRLSLPDGSVDRAPGVLQPEVRVTSELGAQIAVPYFMPFGADRDLTLTPQVSTRSMAGLGFRWRQVFSRGGIELGGQVNRDNLTPQDWRGYGYLRALFALNSGFRLEIDAMRPSDRSYLETYDITDESRIRSHLTLERIRRDQAIRARAVAFQSLRPNDVNNWLPNRVLQAEWEQRLGGLPIGGELTVAGRLHAHRRASGLDGVRGRDIARAGVFMRWQRREILPGGILGTLALQGRVDHVRVSDDSAIPDPVTRRAAEAMVELRWPWTAVDRAGGQQIIEPVVQLIAARRNLVALPNDDHLMPELDAGNLFAPIRYSGLDAPDDGSRANLGLRWVRHAPSGWSIESLVGRVWRRAALSGFGPGHRQPLGQTRSDWLIAARLQSSEGLALGWRLLLDDRRDLSRGEASVTWLRDQGTSIASRYLYVAANPAEDRPQPLNEWSLDLGHRFASGWQGRVGWDYDIGTGEWSAARSGLEFRNECMAVDLSLSRRFATSTNLTASTRFALRVELLGLNGRSPGPGGRACRS